METFSTYELDALRPVAEIVKRYYRGRKVVLWGESPIFRYLLEKDYRIIPERFTVTNIRSKSDDQNRFIGHFKNLAKKYYILVPFLKYENNYKGKLRSLGYTDFEDFVFRYHEPVTILPNSPKYADEYGNAITSNGCTVCLDMGVGNAKIDIDASTQFGIDSVINVINNGNVRIKIGTDCTFKDKFVCSAENGTIQIGNNSFFGANFSIEANNRHHLKIGNTCMFSQDVHLHCAYEQSVFDVETGQKISPFTRDGSENVIDIGDHVWIGFRACIIGKTVIGNSSIIGAGAVGEGNFPNNVAIAGNPMRVIKKNVSWTSNPFAEDIQECGEENIRLTETVL